jgi:hypothetical protein
MTRLVQLRKGESRRAALVDEPKLRLLRDFQTTYSLAAAAAKKNVSLSELVRQSLADDVLEYGLIYEGKSEWRILPPIDHPDEPSRCLISGTGLTHLGSARDRDAMHAPADRELTDSMKMFQLGLQGGRPEPGRIGVAPEWFYKGTGAILRAHGEPLDIPAHGEDGGEEGEIAGIYFIDSEGKPWRIGFSVGNEFSDHRFEKKNYLNLAGSKLRSCSLGPELVIDAELQSVPGEVTLERAGGVLWSKKIRTGEAEMSHSLRNIEHHHFKFDGHRTPGDVHVHYLGADCLSFGDGIELKNGDVMQVQFQDFGRPLRNWVRASGSPPSLVEVKSFQ